ncbi:MAG: hypothetical protein WC197_02385 [Candidatus Gastranaerophilaceae bacterium]|jgi:hypothetical protein
MNTMNIGQAVFVPIKSAEGKAYVNLSQVTSMTVKDGSVRLDTAEGGSTLDGTIDDLKDLGNKLNIAG